jgi:hypothetical protein
MIPEYIYDGDGNPFKVIGSNSRLLTARYYDTRSGGSQTGPSFTVWKRRLMSVEDRIQYYATEAEAVRVRDLALEKARLRIELGLWCEAATLEQLRSAAAALGVKPLSGHRLISSLSRRH